MKITPLGYLMGCCGLLVAAATFAILLRGLLR